jgi:hypothetical protein
MQSREIPAGHERGLTSEESSRYLKEKYNIRRSPKTMANDRVSGTGPRYFNAGRQVLYTPPELDRYAQSLFSGLRSSTSEAPKPAAAA